MAIMMLFEMTLSYDIILPLMLCCVIAYFTAKSLAGPSLYRILSRNADGGTVDGIIGNGQVSEFMKTDAPFVSESASFSEIARMFLSVRRNNLYVVDRNQVFCGAVALHDIKNFLHDPALAQVVIAAIFSMRISQPSTLILR